LVNSIESKENLLNSCFAKKYKAKQLLTKKLKKMKRIHIMLTFALSAIMFTSCEKDDVNQPSNKAIENNKEKGGMYNKSLTSDLEDFTEDILNQVTPDDMDAEQALLFLEAA